MQEFSIFRSSLTESFQKLVCYFRRCKQCGASFSYVDLLCLSCWKEKFYSFFKLTLETSYGANYSVYSLVRWHRENHNFSTILYGLKDGAHPMAWTRLAGLFHASSSQVVKFSESVVFIPAPPKRGHCHRDHAHNFARELSKMFDGNLVIALKRADNYASKGPSKRLNRLGRINSRNIELLPTFDIATLSNRNIVFVDDIITTGSTAKQAYQALGSPKLFQVWTLACRPKEKLL